MDKGKIIDFCSNKGRRFIGCFHELYLCPEKENTIIPEMENLYDAVKGVKLDGKPLLKSYLHDWFLPPALITKTLRNTPHTAKS